MAKLSAKQRKALPASDFAGPNRSFPIPDKSHATQALRMKKFAPNPGSIEEEVHQKFPGVKPMAFGGPVVPGQPMVVGGHGPEVMTPHLPGVMTPNPSMMNPLKAAVLGPRGPQIPQPRPQMPRPSRPKGIKGTTDFKGLMAALKQRG